MKSSGWESLEKSFPCFQKLCSTADRWTWHKFPKISTNNWASGNIEGWVQVPPGSIKTNEKKKKNPKKCIQGPKTKVCHDERNNQIHELTLDKMRTWK